MKKFLMICCLIIGATGIAQAQAPSIGTILSAISKTTPSNPKAITDMLENAGYSYQFLTEQPSYNGGVYTEYVFSKNCKVIPEELSNGVEYSPARETPTSSIITLEAAGNEITHISVQIYAASEFKTWVSQLTKLGFKKISDDSRGNRGQSWEYAKSGKPNFSIWNDLSNMYVLSVSLRPQPYYY